MSLYRRRLRALCGALLAAVAAGGCASSQGSRHGDVHAVWPLPPAPARIALVQSVQGARDFAKPGFFRSVGNLLTGSKRHTLLRPQGVAVDQERLYVTDQERQGVHVFHFNSSKSAFIDHVGDVFFVSPVGVAACDGKIAVSDSALKKVFLLWPDGRPAGTIEKPGEFKRPTGLAFAAGEKLLYVVDTLANEVCVFDLSGKLLRRFGAPGNDAGQFNYPTHVFVDQYEKVYVTDSLNFRVQVFDRKGQFQLAIGKLGDASGHLAVPKGVGVDRLGHIYVVDSYLTTVQIFDEEGRFLLAFGEPGERPGAFHVPTGLTVDGTNRIFVCDSYNSRVQVFQYVGTSDEDVSADR